jgi:hypothetical protein
MVMLWVLRDSDHWHIALQITDPSSRQRRRPKTKRTKQYFRQKKGKRTDTKTYWLTVSRKVSSTLTKDLLIFFKVWGQRTWKSSFINRKELENNILKGWITGRKRNGTRLLKFEVNALVRPTAWHNDDDCNNNNNNNMRVVLKVMSNSFL